MSTEPENLFPTIGSAADKADKATEDTAQEEERPTQEIESLCMKCGEQGITRLLLTTIPFFREVIVMSFRCEHCGTSNNEIQSAGTIRPEGTIYTARILARSDLNRQIVRSPNCEILVPEFELTLPASKRGQLTTVEGLLRDVVADLSMDQPLRRIQNPESHSKIQVLINKFKEILGDVGDEDEDFVVGKAAEKDHLPMPPFTLKLDDPSGNSFIEFVGTDGMADPKWNMRTYPRTLQQNVDLGLISPDDAAAAAEKVQVKRLPSASVASTPSEADENIGGGDSGVNEEIYVFPGVCSSCGHPMDTLMKKVNIPYFQDILIMSSNCIHCGYRDNEVKSGAAISEKGKRIILKVEDAEDLTRDILKSETAGLSIPEISLDLNHGTLGGRFTTLEGILEQVYEELSEKAFVGDSSTGEDRKAFEDFLSKLKEVKSASRPFTLILDDPLANSYLQNLYAPDPDPNMTVEVYDRSWQQNEELGLNDIKVEGYEEDAQKTEATPATESVAS